ncbi:hypothetical protein VNO78_05519 [Psophocarpus tetragonolobus]|uniref:Uncharacterized protein n=1 Tax=Psophocarpus tetragonolobus TaxID=3891 RepID=A0AAN9SSF3_PSOTE
MFCFINACNDSLSTFAIFALPFPLLGLALRLSFGFGFSDRFSSVLLDPNYHLPLNFVYSPPSTCLKSRFCAFKLWPVKLRNQ